LAALVVSFGSDPHILMSAYGTATRFQRPALLFAGRATPGSPIRPPLVYVPLPTEPFNVRDVAPVTVMTQVPFAAVFPLRPANLTTCPVERPWAAAEVTEMGETALPPLV